MDADSDALIGHLLGHYQLEKKLGQGGMGAVYRALDTHLNRPVAVKVLLRDAGASPESKRRFFNEARAASALNHPNIVHVYDINQDQGIDYIALEFVSGQTFDKLCQGGLPIQKALMYAQQAVDALAAAHAAGILHRDIKPSNLMVNENGLVKVLDFGLAKLIQSGGSDSTTETLLTREGTIVGTVGYMSPEQASGLRVDARSDVFSFGAVLYEMLTGRRAFARATTAATLSAVLHDEPPSISELVQAVPEDLENLVVQCLRKKPELRIQTMEEIKRALAELQDQGTASTLISRRNRSQVKRRWVQLLLASIAVAIATLTFLIYKVMPSKPPQGVLAAEVRPLTSMPGWEMHPSWSPDGRMILFSNNMEGSMDVFMMPVTGGDPLRLTHDAADDLSPRMSPDSKYIAYVADLGTGANVYLIPPLGAAEGGERKLVETGVHALEQLSLAASSLGTNPWFPDGQSLIFAKAGPSGETAIWRVDIPTGSLAQITNPLPNQSDFDASVTYDGATILFNRLVGGKATLWVVPAAGGQPRMVFDSSPARWPAWSSDGRRILFTSPRAGPQNVWELEVDSGNLRQITSGPGWDMYASVSRSGRLAYTQYGHKVDLYFKQLQSHSETRLTDHSRESFLPSFAPDGKRLVYQSDQTGNNEIWLLDLVTKAERDLTSNTFEDTAPDWSPDGREIAFVSNRDGRPRVWTMDPEGGSARRLSDAVVPELGETWMAGQIAPRWSPDGNSIAFIAATEKGNSLWVANRDGSNAHPHINGVLYFDWCKDGRHVVFTRRGTSGVSEIDVADLANDQESLLTKEAAIELDVSPDGKTLLYTHALSHFGMNLFTIELETGADGLPRVVSQPKQITDGKAEWHAHKGAWSPVSKSIVYTRDADQGDIYTIENYK